jgi:imidazolonepropionase-like amidohydrolase
MRPLLTLLVASALSLPAQVTVLSHATIIDGTGNPPIRDGAIVMENGHIAAMGPASKLHAPAGAQVIDLSGKTIIPGIFNLHSHIDENTPAKLSMYAHYGITSTIGMGGDGDEVLKIRRAQRHGDLQGARLYTVLSRFEFEKDAKTPEEARAKVDELYRRGADAVKLVVDDRRHTIAKLKPEIQLAIIDQTHKHGLKAMAHMYYYDDAKFLMDHGVEIFAHEVRDREVDDAFINEMKAKNVTVTPTLVREISSYIYADSPAWLDDPFLLKWMPAARVQEGKTKYKDLDTKDPEMAINRREFEIASKNLKKMSAAGVRIGFGTDTGHGNPRYEGFFEHLEMQLMVEPGGMTPMQVIQAYSKTNSEAFGVDKEYGTLAKGKAADLVVLDKSPLDSILNTRSINTVYLAGKKYE